MGRRKPTPASPKPAPHLPKRHARSAILEAQRTAALLADDEPGRASSTPSWTTLREPGACAMPIGCDCLRSRARQEEAEAVVKRRADLVVRFEKKLAEADREADELQNLLAQAEKKFRASLRANRCQGRMADRRLARQRRCGHCRGRSVIGRRRQTVAVLAPLSNRRAAVSWRPTGRDQRGGFPRRRLPKERSARPAPGHNAVCRRATSRHRSSPSI